MEYLIGAIVGLVVSSYGTVVGMDRGRSFYPTVLIVVASYYYLFAAIGGSNTVLAIELLAGLGFSMLATIGFKKSMWLVSAGIAGHGVFDLFFHHLLVENPGMPVWWPGFCAAADVVLGGWLAVRLWRGQTTS